LVAFSIESTRLRLRSTTRRRFHDSHPVRTLRDFDVILYGLALGIVLGLLAGGRIMRLAELDLRWGWVGLAAIGLQVILFSTPVGSMLGWLAPVGYVVTTGAVLLAVFLNIRMVGMPLIAAGAVTNFAAVLANGGYMPSTPEALASAGRAIEPGYSNSAVLQHPALAPLTDIFAIPAGVPLSNVFSVGDVLIAAGIGILVFWVIVHHGSEATETARRKYLRT
jgi:Family of unknown function (DUF5317)